VRGDLVERHAAATVRAIAEGSKMAAGWIEQPT
jgi:hypothetical protein